MMIVLLVYSKANGMFVLEMGVDLFQGEPKKRKRLLQREGDFFFFLFRQCLFQTTETTNGRIPVLILLACNTHTQNTCRQTHKTHKHTVQVTHKHTVQVISCVVTSEEGGGGAV